MNVPEEGARSLFHMLSSGVSLATMPVLSAWPLTGWGVPLTSPEAHPAPPTFQSSSPKGTNPEHLQLPKVRCFRSHSLPLRKCTGQQARELSGELALEGEAPGAVSATCFLLPDCAMPSSEAGKTGEGGQHAEGAAWLISGSSTGLLSSAAGPALLGRPHPAQAMSFPSGGNVQARCTKGLLEAFIPLTLSG